MKYKDILNLEHYHEPGQPFMSLHDRAAQFMPFKSLKGYDEMIDENEKNVLEDDREGVIYDEIIFM